MLKPLQTFVGGGVPSVHLSACRQLASRLQIGINKLMRECRVKGEDHAALHHWLEPLLEQITLLAQSKKLAPAQKAYAAIVVRVGLFDTYFKVGT